MRLKPESLFLIKKQRVLIYFFFQKKKKKEKHKNKYSKLRKRSPACRLDRHGFKRGLEEL